MQNLIYFLLLLFCLWTSTPISSVVSFLLWLRLLLTPYPFPQISLNKAFPYSPNSAWSSLCGWILHNRVFHIGAQFLVSTSANCCHLRLCSILHLFTMSLTSTYNVPDIENPGMTTWHCVLIICRDLLILRMSMACLPCPFSCQLTKPALPTCSPALGLWPLFPHVSECGSDWAEQEEKEGHDSYKELCAFCSFIPSTRAGRHNSSLHANYHCVLHYAPCLGPSLQYLQHLSLPLRVFTERPSSPWGLSWWHILMSNTCPPASLSPSLLYFPLWQLSPCHILYLALSLLLSPALEHRFHDSRVLSVLFSVITLPARSGVAEKVLKELLLNKEWKKVYNLWCTAPGTLSGILFSLFSTVLLSFI